VDSFGIIKRQRKIETFSVAKKNDIQGVNRREKE